MTPDTDTEARAAAASHMIEVVERLAEADTGSAVFAPQLAHDSFLQGYLAGRARGLEEAAEICLAQHIRADIYSVAQAIRAAAKGEGK